MTILLMGIVVGTEVDLFIPSFPQLQEQFHLSPVLVQLTLSMNFLAYCIGCFFVGPMGDRFNRRYVILGGLAIFVIGSLFCATADQYAMLILGRFLQGLGISAPSVLAFAVIADDYPIEKQTALMGIFNGVVTCAMAIAPVIGSWVTQYFGWHGNFNILLLMGIISFITSYLVLPHKPGDTSISLSPKAYVPLLCSVPLLTYTIGLGFIMVGYWLFIGMAPLLYMEGLGVSLPHFGYYQGAICLVYSTLCILSPAILKRFSQKSCFYFGVVACIISAFFMLIIALLGVQNPMMITSSMLIFAIGAVFPINILYPQSLVIIENSKGRANALLQGGRLILTSILLEVVSFYYTGQFFPIGITIFVLIIGAIYFYRILLQKNWVTFAAN